MAVGKTVFALWWQEAIVDYKTLQRKPTLKELATLLKTTESEIKSRFWAEYDPESDALRPVGLHCDELRIIVRHFQKKYAYFCITNSSILEHESKRIRRSVAPLWAEHVHLPRNTSPIIYRSGGARKRYNREKPVISSLRDVPRASGNIGDSTRLDDDQPAKD